MNQFKIFSQKLYQSLNKLEQIDSLLIQISKFTQIGLV